MALTIMLLIVYVRKPAPAGYEWANLFFDVQFLNDDGGYSFEYSWHTIIVMIEYRYIAQRFNGFAFVVASPRVADGRLDTAGDHRDRRFRPVRGDHRKPSKSRGLGTGLGARGVFIVATAVLALACLLKSPRAARLFGRLPVNGAISLMQVQLDPRTLVVVAAFVAVVPTTIAALVWRTRPTYPGFGRWTVANLLDTLCLILFSLRGTVPDWISIVLANASALCAGLLFFQGSRRFRGLRLLWWPECVTGILGLVAVIYFRYVTNAMGARTIASNIALGIFGVACGFTFLRKIPSVHRFSMALTGVIFSMAGIFEVFRGFYAYIYEPQPDMFAPSAVNAFLFVGAGMVAVGWTFGFILMTGERLLQESKRPRGLDAAARVRHGGTYAPGRTVTEAEVRQQLTKIIASDTFRRSACMVRFLSLTVERALMGQPEKLKEYALGRDVFDRSEDYDPRLDAIVRVEAQRLRRKLREYYESFGREDFVIVELHSGSYVPVFRCRESGAEASHGAFNG